MSKIRNLGMFDADNSLIGEFEKPSILTCGGIELTRSPGMIANQLLLNNNELNQEAAKCIIAQGKQIAQDKEDIRDHQEAIWHNARMVNELTVETKFLKCRIQELEEKLCLYEEPNKEEAKDE